MYGDYVSHEDWNPMEEAFYDERFNTYEAGPGADLDRSLQPCFRKRNDNQRPPCKLYVHQIPRNLSEEGLRNVFLKFGSPRSVYLCKKPHTNNMFWGLVEYSTVSEGQEAINTLNGRPPLNLSVQFARSDEEKERIRREYEQETLFRKMSYPQDSYGLPEIESHYSSSFGRGRGVPMMVSASSVDSFYSNKPFRLSNDELIFRRPIPRGVFNPYQGSVWDPTNAHVMGEVALTVNSSEDGRRISMGRGVPCSELKSRRLRSHKFGLQRSSVDHNELRIGLCAHCYEPSIYSCERCGAWYCSEECQAEDWPIHREVCRPFLCKKSDPSDGRGGSSVRTEEVVEGKKKGGQITEGKESKSMQKGDCERWKKAEGSLGKGEGWEEGKNYRRGALREEGNRGALREEGNRGALRGEGNRGALRGEGNRGALRGEGNRGALREEGNKGALREEGNKGALREEGKKNHWGDRKNEVRNYQRGGGREEGRNRRKGEEESWKKKNITKKDDSNRIPPSAPDDDDWDKEKEPCSPEKSSPRGSKVSNDCSQKISQTAEHRNEKYTLDPRSPGKSRIKESRVASEESRKVAQTVELTHEKSTVDPCSPGKSSIKGSQVSTEERRNIAQTVELSREKFTMVNVGAVVSRGRYWVQSKDQEDELRCVMKVMSKAGKPSIKPMNLNSGDYCSALFEGFPYRAKVLSVKNEEAEVFFVDFGNVDTCKFSSIGELPPDAWNYRSQAIEIVMADHTPEKFTSLSENAVISVKPVSKLGNSQVVRVEGVKYEEMHVPLLAEGRSVETDPVTTDQSRKHWPRSVLAFVKEGKRVVCDVFDVVKGDEDMVILGLAFDDIAQELFTIFRDFPDKCSDIVLDPAFKPNVGDLVAAGTGEEKFLRGVVLREESTGWMVAFCDTGSMCVVEDLRKMPDDPKYREAPAFAVQCRILKSYLPRKDLYSENRIEISSRLQLNIIACTGEEVTADMLTKDGELICKVKLEPWKPEVSHLSCKILNNGDKVHIVSYFNTAAIFVQPADEMSQKSVQSLLQEVAGACTGGQGRIQEVPSKGALVACKFSGDGNYYRALVMDVKEDQQLFVSYVDFGNQEWVPLEKVQKLPENLKKIPCFAVKIGLRVSGLSKLPPDAARMLNTYILNSEELKIVFPDGDLRNCELYTKSGQSLNEKIAELAENSPVSSSTTSDSRMKWSPDMAGKLDIPDGASLSMKFLILHCPGRCTIVGCPAEDPRIVQVYKTFPLELSEHCDSCPVEPYVPVAYELCLAKFTDDVWYRGFALDAKGDESQIYFVDFGNWAKVKHRDIRKMVTKFMKIPFIAVLCTYKGFEEETISKEQENALKQYLKPNSLFIASVSQGQAPDEYILDIPEVTQALRSKNLLP